MFKIALTETYTAPVSVELPGTKTKQVFEAEFRRLSRDEITRLYSRAGESEIDDAGFCREVMVGWRGVSDETGPIEFSPAALDTLLAIYPLAACIVQSFNASLAVAKQKN